MNPVARLRFHQQTAHDVGDLAMLEGSLEAPLGGYPRRLDVDSHRRGSLTARRRLIQLAEDDGGELPSSITHESLAKLISSTRETVTKFLGQFADEGLVELGYRRIRVLDWPGLQQIAARDGMEPPP